MSKKVSLPVFIAVCAFLVIITFQITFLAVTNKYRNENIENAATQVDAKWLDKLESVDELTRQYFLKEISEERLMEFLPAAYVAALGDKYTYYMTKEEYESYMSSMNAETEGIGVHVTYNSEEDAVEVVGVMNGSPALENGVCVGDLIFKIEGQEVKDIGYDGAMTLMLGESGTTISFSVKRPVAESFEIIDFSIERRAVVEETVTFSLHGTNVGIVRISQFDKGTFAQFKNAIDNLTAQGADRFVFDVRYNLGGDLNAISQVLDMLLPEGPIVRYADKYGRESVINSNAECIDYPFSVIVNGSTVSAAELFAAALKDYEKATIVGEKTYGKGTMQSVFELDDGSAVSMTIGRYYPPFSDGYDGQGVIPHKTVSIAEEYKNISIYNLTFEQDAQLQAAVEAVTGK